ncbi:FKBP-type peptidyl-prolyl cis-trans isomerase [Vulgatibacter incomptus]|uniref:Peptidyl-prolyl cis-trans isomerase n=1 Tax=Vulgatibacter incomptus TaxID=1391653 RepID=A0A0K1PHF9_9BACT|nr:peptidylprolyl isomerase [Vulgatibacter incomptus]AKU92947.1 FKBP-type peptidyl-prolyl cis-trans isomerase SlyD [Vulgatibacter incomptus]
MKATNGVVVSLQYTLMNAKGEELETSVGSEPLAYLHGEGEIVPGLERELEGKEIGFKSRVMVPAADAYGERDEDAVFEAPKDELPEGIEAGEEIFGEDEDGEPMSFTVVKLTENGAILDTNHPFAGMDLTFDVEIVGLRPATEEELEHGHAHDAEGCDDLEDEEGEEEEQA